VDNSELKVLAEAVIVKDWSLGEYEAAGGKAYIVMRDPCNHIITVFEPTAAKFIAKCTPSAVLALITENERLTGFVVHRREQADQYDEALTKVADQRDQLKAECEGLRKALTDCSDSLHSEMLQKFGGQLPDDMHPVTRRDYDRDMAEVAGYRAAVGGIEPALDTPEFAGLRLDAGRYRWLCDSACDVTFWAAGTPIKGRAEIEPDQYLVRDFGSAKTELDAAIDAAMGKGEQS
jgi:hypothetical protein